MNGFRRRDRGQRLNPVISFVALRDEEELIGECSDYILNNH